MRIQWIGQAATLKSANVSNLECINLFAEMVESTQGKTPVALHGTPGCKQIMALPRPGMRGMYVTSRGRLFVICGGQLVEILSDNTFLVRGTINTVPPGILTAMTENGLDLLLTTDTTGFRYTLATDTLAALVDPDFLGSTHAGFLDGRFILLQPHSARFYWSDIYSTNFNALDFATAEGSPDVLVALLIAHREIWLFGTQTVEVWAPTGGAGVFARLGGALLEYGCMAPYSPALVGDTICWLAQNTQGDCLVLQAEGLTPRRISTFAVEQSLNSALQVSDAVGWGYQDEGHIFYWLNLPSAGVTWVYDLSAGLWHKRQSYNLDWDAPRSHRAYLHAFAHGRHYIGDQYTGEVCMLDHATYTDAGLPILRSFVTPPVFDPSGLGLLSHAAVEIECETGVGLDGAVIPGTDPHLLLSYSDDGGHEFTPGHRVSLGPIGQYRTRVRRRRLGQARDRRYRGTFSDPCALHILGAYVDVNAV